MNVTLAPFLFVMSELDAFFAYSCLLQHHCPRYVLKNLDGCHHGCDLLEKCLSLLDNDLHAHLTSRHLHYHVFAFPAIATLLASMQPLEEVLRLWDAIFAFGVHLSILIFCSQLMLMRDELLKENSAAR
jgi:cell cycle arrest protein BUB2